jgi:autotransporter-associated beta strand protein
VAGDTAKFANDAGEIEVGAGDLELFKSLPVITAVSFSSTTRIVMLASGDITLTNAMVDVWFVNRGGANVTLSKCGDKTYQYCNFIVENGSLALTVEPLTVASYYNFGNIAVSNGATLYLAHTAGIARPITCPFSLNSEGVVSPYAEGKAGIRISGNAGAPPSLIRGTMQGDIDLQPYATNVYLLGSAHTFTGNVRPWTYNGNTEKVLLGVEKLGMTTDPSSSVGTVGSLSFLYNGARYLYLGGGETTDRQINWVISWYDYSPYHEPEFDAGATGGVTFTGTWTTHGTGDKTKTPHTTLVLSGSNTVPCVVAGKISTTASDAETSRSVYITKRGTGTWRFNDHGNRKNTGVIAVEEGTLQFESIAEKGVVCSLGLATDLYGKFFGYNTNMVAAVDYALLLGTTNVQGAATTEGVLDYVGEGEAKCSTRPIALLGDGRLCASGGRIEFSGVSAATAGEKTFALDGTNAFVNVLQGVSDGAGVLSIAKYGTNTWKLAGSLEFGGDIAVNGGTLEVLGTGLPYTWFRFNSYEVQSTRLGVAETYRYQHKFDEFALFDANGVRQNVGFTCPDNNKEVAGYYDVTGDATEIAPGTMGPGRAGQWYFYKGTTYGLAKLTDQSISSGNTFIGWYRDSSSAADASSIDRPEHRLTFVTRLTNGTPEIARYDFCSSSMNAASVSNCPSTFSLEGSIDGVSWTLLHTVTNNPVNSGGGRWVSDDTPFNTKYTNIGYQVVGHVTAPMPLTRVRSVRVAAGATLRASGEVAPIRGLVVDANGAGTIDGFSFSDADGCTLNVLNAGQFSSLALPGEYLNVSGLENVTRWNLRLDGESKTSVTAVVVDGELRLMRKGTVFLIR